MELESNCKRRQSIETVTSCSQKQLFCKRKQIWSQTLISFCSNLSRKSVTFTSSIIQRPKKEPRRLNNTQLPFVRGMLTATLTVVSLLITLNQSCLGFDSLKYQHYVNQQQQLPVTTSNLVAQARVAGLEPSDYVDEAGELEIMANQQQIPTAQLMAAAGHIVPENFFLPGGSIPAIYSRYPQQQQQQSQQAQQQQQQQQQDQTAESSYIYARHMQAQPQATKYARQVDLSNAANEQHVDTSQLIDFNGYNLVAQPDGRESTAHSVPVDLAEFLAPATQSQLFYEQQQQQYAEQQAASELAALLSGPPNQNSHNLQYQQQQQNLDNSAMSSENIMVSSADQYGSTGSLGPAYQVSGQAEGYNQVLYLQEQEKPQRPYGLPTKSSSKEPSGMLKPLGNPKQISSPAIDFVANHLPKTSGFEKLAEKFPQSQVPTVFSFASSKDPVEKTKGLNQKKRNVMKQAEQLARTMIKSLNDKLGTTIGDQTDIPFLLSTLGPLGIAQNILLDPTLLVTLLNSAEKTYFSDVLPAPAKMAIRPVLNIFRVPNRKRDKANLINIISYLASGGQTPSSSAVKHRQPLGVEKQSTDKTTKTKTA